MNNKDKILTILEQIQTETNRRFDKLEQGQLELTALVHGIQRPPRGGLRPAV